MKSFRYAAALAAGLILGLGSSATLAAVLNISFGAEDVTQREAYKALVSDFRAANPDVEVHLTLTDTPTYRKTLPPSLDTDAAPDVFNWFAGDQMRSMALKGQLDDVSDVWKTNTWW